MSSHASDHATQEPQGLQARRDQVVHLLHHYAHMLSEQGPMNITFVHNNTLLGLQHLHFEAAIAEASRVMGGRGFEPLEQYRKYWSVGRISDADVDKALSARAGLDLDAPLLQMAGQVHSARAVLRAHLVYGIDTPDSQVLVDAFDAQAALAQWMSDTPESSRQALLATAPQALSRDVARVGADWLMSDWLGSFLALEVGGELMRRAANREGHDAPDARLSLEKLGIPASSVAGYLACVDRRRPANFGNGAEAQAQWRATLLDEEQRLVRSLLRRHLDISGAFEAVRGHFAAHPQAYVLRRLWSESLRLSGSPDPFGPTDPVSFLAREVRSDAPEAALSRMEQSDPVDGPPVALNTTQAQVLDQWLIVQQAEAQSPNGQALIAALRAHVADHQLEIRSLRAMRGLLQAAPEAPGYAVVADVVTALEARAPRNAMFAHARALIQADADRVGERWTHGDWLATLTGQHVVDRVNAYMIRACAAFLDEGLASWHMPDRRLGFYGAWRKIAVDDLSFAIDGAADWKSEIAALPERADDAILYLFDRLGLQPAQWDGTIARMLAQLKGWAGMVYWYETHPKQYRQSAHPMDTAQYLAVRLFCEWMCLRQVCNAEWGLAPRLQELREHFLSHPCDYYLRRQLHAHRLQDSIAQSVRSTLSGGSASERLRCADAAWLYAADARALDDVASGAWRLFRTAQLVGWNPDALASLTPEAVAPVLPRIDAFSESQQAPIWLAAFEAHYRDEILNAMALNRGRGRWAQGRTRRPKSQVVFCIDEREENIHRHYEELDPDHETLGAAGFFGVAQAYIGLDDHDHTPLCPAVATPAHRVLEIPRAEALEEEFPVHKRRGQWKSVFDNSYWETKRNLVSSFFLIHCAGLLMSIPLLGRVLAPHRWGRMAEALHDAVVPPVRTRLTHVRIDEAQAVRFGLQTFGHPIGFTNEEASDRVEASLRNWGLTYQFARIVVICAHRSISVNNPHENAHDCGACGGKAGGPNARLFAALANHGPVREILRQRGIDIPSDTWFVGAEHNTANSQILYFDTQDIPAALSADWEVVHRDLEEARMRSARERCRRFASAPKDASLEVSTRHVEERTLDLSQVRPEWGHCTNAFAVVGRRMITQGVFFDRRGFIISYDPTQDPDGRILERILMAVGPVGAGISLEYYFSTVDPVVYGCDTKVPHNVVGMIGVMAGAHGDLQTGLPRQMTEVHEAMRLQLVVDAKMEVLGGIYGRQAAIRQLLDNQWVHLIAHDPDTGEFNLFVPGKGFEKWDEPLRPIPKVAESFDWFRGHYECFLPPAMIQEPTASWTEVKGTARTSGSSAPARTPSSSTMVH